MHTKPGLRVLLEWKINRSGSVITDVMPFKELPSQHGTSPAFDSHPKRKP